MGISDDIRPKHKKHLEKESVKEEKDNPLKSEDISDIIEPLPDTYEEDVNIDSAKSFFETPKPAKKSPEKPKSIWLVITLIILVLALISIAVYQNLDLVKKKLFKKNSQTTETPISNTSNSDTASATAETADTATQETQPEQPVTTAVAPVVIDKSSFTIRVCNGNGTKGSADKVGDALKAAGFNVTSVGNAGSYNYKTTIIYYKSGKEAEANMIKEALSTRTVSTEISTTLKTYDILVIVGAK